jgi:hypothetical protein
MDFSYVASRSKIMPEDWTREEVEIIVAEYFDMLAKEQSGVRYSKSETRSRILPLLKKRSNGSVEFKNRNISAVLSKMGQPYIRGYLPAYNYQKVLLEEAVSTYLQRKPEIEDTFKLFASNAPSLGVLAFESMVESIPEKNSAFRERELVYRSPIQVNYIELEQANRTVGKAGEGIALEYERWRLIQAGKDYLADKIEWVSQTQGDGLGFDILSRNVNGTDRYIEVKATKLTKDAPFYFSALEYDFSKRNRSNFFLYRVFNMKATPKLFIASGAYDDFCNMGPTQFKGTF